MQKVNVPAALAGAARWVGGNAKKAVNKVNPDVWREFAFVSMLSYSLLMPKREEVVDRGDDGCPPVVLVHGLGGNRGAWLPLRLFLKMNGHRRVYAFGYEEGTIEEHAQRLRDFIDAVRRATGEAQVDLVCHSLGGLISRYVIQRLDRADAVRNLITVATPNRGTYAAQYANTPVTIALRPDSDFMRDLNGKRNGNRPARFVAIYSDRDMYIVPHDRMTHPDAENVFIPNISHSQYLVSPAVFREIIKHLE